MKTFFFCLALFASLHLFAQQTGEAAAQSTETAARSWKNVWFGIGVASAAVIGVVITSIDEGKSAH